LNLKIKKLKRRKYNNEREKNNNNRFSEFINGGMFVGSFDIGVFGSFEDRGRCGCLRDGRCGFCARRGFLSSESSRIGWMGFFSED
jgi:hypothetical protein